MAVMKKDNYIVQVRHLSKIYKMGEESVTALDDVSLDISKGEVCCIFGPSGSGKSTLLNQLAGLEKPSRGAVKIAGHIVSKMDENQLAGFRQKYTGFIFQSYNLLNSLNALENTALPLEFAGVEESIRNKKALSMLKRVGLAKRKKHYPSQMSGGQQQRVGIARAFVNKPEVVFADEPTGNLDSKSSKEIMEMMVLFAREYNQTIIVVSHDQDMAKYADHIITLKDGKIVKEEFIERKEWIIEEDEKNVYKLSVNA